jgi:hypothetical protein
MKLAKYLGVSLLVVVGLFLFVANFSSVASNYECKGEIASGETKAPKTIYIVLEEYRWWVGLWGDSDGNVKLEIPNEHLGYYSHVVEVGNQLQIYDPPNEMKGHYSTLSKTLALKTPYGFFDGKCVVIK